MTRTKRSIYATVDDLRQIFTERREQLHWLALFLTGEETLANACLSHASLLAITPRQVIFDWREHWARRSIILTAAKIQQTQILQLAAAYRPRPCGHRGHLPLPGPELKILKELPHEIASRIDVFSRFALVMRGIENYSLHQTALMLEVSSAAVDAAYCAALASLNLLDAEASERNIATQLCR
jgi:hypothetical protein